MDADTRHQLKQNELAQALRQLWDFSDWRTSAWLAVILVVALGYAGYKVWGWRQHAAVLGAYQALGSVNATDASLGDAPLAQLRQLIAQNHQPGLVAISRLQLARGLEARGQDVEDAPELSEAETQYQAIRDIAEAPSHIKAVASFRLGMLYETKRDFAKARDVYTSLSSNPDYRGSPFTDLAATRLDHLDDLATPIKFEPGAKPLATAPPVRQPVAIREITGTVEDEFVGPPPTPTWRPPPPRVPAAHAPSAPAAESSKPQQP